MALFTTTDPIEEEDFIGPSDAATRALSVTVVETDFVARVYQKLASVYDWVFGPTLQAGRLQALQQMAISPGDRILEVGVGTGINLALYPRDCSITGIDLDTRKVDALMQGKASDPAAWPGEFRIDTASRPGMQHLGNGHYVRAA